MTSLLQFDLFAPAWQVTERVSARARNIRIEVPSAEAVVLVIPRWASRRQAREFLDSRRDWIAQKQAELKLRHAHHPVDARRLRWDGRDQFPLRGVDLPLRLTPATLRSFKLRIEPDAIELFCPPARLADREALARALREALKHEALQDARRLLTEEAARLGVSFEGPRIADQKTLWGSCASSGLISLSWRLVLAPPAVFRYVVIHELCHRLHLDHSEAFWARVAQQMPDYETHYRWLREHGARLHLYLAD